MYIETTPDTAYTKLPATLLDGNNPIEYGTLDSLQLRYLDGGLISNGLYESDYKNTATFDTVLYYSDTQLQFNYKIPDSSCLAFAYKNGIDNTKGCYLDGNTAVFDTPAYRITQGDGISQRVDGNLPSGPAACLVRTKEDIFIDLNLVKDLGYKVIQPKMVYYADSSLNSNYPESDGGWNKQKKTPFNIFNYRSEIYAAYDDDDFQVIINSNTKDMQTIGDPGANLREASVYRTHDITNAQSVQPKAIIGGEYHPTITEMDTTVGLKQCILLSGTEDLWSCYFPKLGLKKFYSATKNLWLSNDQVIVVGSNTGTHVLDTKTGAMKAKETIPLLIYDEGPMASPYRYQLVIPELVGVPIAKNGTVTLEHNAAKLKGLVNIDGKAYWCELSFLKQISCQNICTYTITSSSLVAHEDVAKVLNSGIQVVKLFNKDLIEGIDC